MSTELLARDRTSSSPRATDADRQAAKNRLLEALSPDTRASLEPHLERVTLEIGDILARVGDPWSHLYFPEGAAVSVLKHMDNGSTIEVGTVGNEGIVGLPALLGARSCETDAVAPIPGPALRVPVGVVLTTAHDRPELLEVVHRYTQAYLAQVAQNAACNQLHGLEQRCARWLLMAHDRAGDADVIPLRHAYLAMMLGVHRPAITHAVGALQARGLISYRRGRMRLVDRAGLEAATCECYRVVRQQFDRLLPRVAARG
jgi:CRP-like cAMP-binding protein